MRKHRRHGLPREHRAKGLAIGEKASGTYKSIGMINYAVEVYQK